MDKLNLSPVPSMDSRLAAHDVYRNHEIDADLGAHDALVSLHELGVAGQSYYSRPNRFVPEPDESIDKTPRLRGEVARQLADINNALKNSDEVQEYFIKNYGRRVELYVDDSVRPVELQKLLYDIHELAAIAKNLGKVRDSGLIVIDEEVTNSPRGIAPPSDNPKSPTPHSTGAAMDVKFRLIPEPYTPMFSKDSDFIDMGNISGSIDTYRPDFYEVSPEKRTEVLNKMTPENSKKLLDNWDNYRELRRLFYYTMTSLAANELHVNPKEWWHWSYGDQMHANTEKQLGRYVVAKYGAV